MQLLNIGIFFRMKTKARKWYKRVLYHFTDLCVVNAYILNKEQSQDPLYQFKLNVALSLMYGEHFGNPMDIGEIILRQAANRQAGIRPTANSRQPSGQQPTAEGPHVNFPFGF